MTGNHYKVQKDNDASPTNFDLFRVNVERQNLQPNTISQHGIPEVLLSDNGPQFISAEFSSSCESYHIDHWASSPYWPQGNGKAEAVVNVAKSLLKKSQEFAKFQFALLDYRNTPPQGHSFTPVQRSMGRRTKQLLPAPVASLMPLSDTSAVVQGEIQTRHQRAAAAYNNHHQVTVS